MQSYPALRMKLFNLVPVMEWSFEILNHDAKQDVHLARAALIQCTRKSPSEWLHTHNIDVFFEHLNCCIFFANALHSAEEPLYEKSVHDDISASL